MALHLEVRDILYMAPLLAVIVVIALGIAAKRRSLLVLVPIAVIATSLGFDMVAYATGSILSSFRYFINAIPLEALLVGGFFATAPTARVARGYRESPAADRPVPMAKTTRRSFWITVPGVLIALIVRARISGTFDSEHWHGNVKSARRL